MSRLRALPGLLALFLSSPLWPQVLQPDFKGSVTTLIGSSPILSQGFVGYKVVSLETGEVVAESNGHNFFIPASNTKLYTTAAALARLGPDYKFQTELRTTARWVSGTQTLPDLQLIGGGDPNLSGRVLPYNVHAQPGDPLGPLKELADKLAGEGVREIEGDVTAVATRYPGDPYPDGWTVDDANYGYGAPISALTIDDNTITLKLHPTKAGELPAVETNPPGSYLTVLNEVTTDATNVSQIHLMRPPGSNEVLLWGTIGKHAPAWEQDLAIDDPARFAAENFVDVLRERGVTVRGEPRWQYCQPTEASGSSKACESLSTGGTVIVSRQSAPLWQIVQVVNKVSQNLHAEMLLRELSFATDADGTLLDGVKARQDFLAQISINSDGTGFALQDGSGLARGDLMTPDSTVALLNYMWKQPVRDQWLQSLPVGGVDGTLQHRFHNMVAADHVHAKTGSLSHVNTLSGYIQTQSHGWLAFSVMVNATAGEEAPVRDFLDKFCGLFLAY